MNFNKYFVALCLIVILGLLSQHVAEANFFGELKRDAERDIHKVGDELDHDKHEVENDIHDDGHDVENRIHKVGHKLENVGHKVEKTAKKAYKIYKIVQDVETAGKVIEVAGAVAGAVRKL